MPQPSFACRMCLQLQLHGHSITSAFDTNADKLLRVH